MCIEAGITRSSYYYSLSHNAIKERDKKIVEAIKNLPGEQRIRGTEQKVIFLGKQGIKVSYKRLWRICHENGLLSHIRKRKHPKNYYASHKEEMKHTVSENILNRNFKSEKPLKKMCTDITYIKVKRGWLYLSVIIDLYNREIISFVCSNSVDTKLALDTVANLKKLYHHVEEECILHSDQGATYTSKEFHNFIIDNGFIQSMSRKGNCHDNAVVENFFGTLKSEIEYEEILKNGTFSYTKMEKLIAEFIKYYNARRIQKLLGFKSPIEYRITYKY